MRDYSSITSDGKIDLKNAGSKKEKCKTRFYLIFFKNVRKLDFIGIFLKNYISKYAILKNKTYPKNTIL